MVAAIAEINATLFFADRRPAADTTVTSGVVRGG